MTKMDWDQVEAAVETIANTLKEYGPQPTVICAVPRGGWVPAALIAEHLNIKRTLSVDIERSVSREISVFLSSRQIDEKDMVLVIEDTTDSGNTIIAVKDKIIQLFGCEVRTVAINHTSKSKKIDFSLGIAEPLPTFPWDH